MPFFAKAASLDKLFGSFIFKYFALEFQGAIWLGLKE
jgi:hypothetical protein